MIVVICPDCHDQTGEYKNGPAEIFEARLKCQGGCPEPLSADPDAEAAMARMPPDLYDSAGRRQERLVCCHCLAREDDRECEWRYATEPCRWGDP